MLLPTSVTVLTKTYNLLADNTAGNWKQYLEVIRLHDDGSSASWANYRTGKEGC